MSMGLTKQQIVNMLTESNINDGQSVNAEELKEAIAKVIVENNNIIQRGIIAEIKKSATNVVSSDLAKMMRRGY